MPAAAEEVGGASRLKGKVAGNSIFGVYGAVYQRLQAQEAAVVTLCGSDGRSSFEKVASSWETVAHLTVVCRPRRCAKKYKRVLCQTNWSPCVHGTVLKFREGHAPQQASCMLFLTSGGLCF